MLLTMNLEILGEHQSNKDFVFSYKSIKQPGLYRFNRSHFCWSFNILFKSQTKLSLIEFRGNFQSPMEACWKAFRQLRS